MPPVLTRRDLLRAGLVGLAVACTNEAAPEPTPAPEHPDLSLLFAARDRLHESRAAYAAAARSHAARLSRPLAGLNLARDRQLDLVAQHIEPLLPPQAQGSPTATADTPGAPTGAASGSPAATPGAVRLDTLVAMEQRHSTAHLDGVRSAIEARHALLLADLGASAARHVVALRWLAGAR